MHLKRKSRAPQCLQGASEKTEEEGEALTRREVNVFTVRMVNHRNRLPREAVGFLPLKVFRILLHNCS